MKRWMKRIDEMDEGTAEDMRWIVFVVDR